MRVLLLLGLLFFEEEVETERERKRKREKRDGGGEVSKGLSIAALAFFFPLRTAFSRNGDNSNPHSMYVPACYLSFATLWQRPIGDRNSKNTELLRP